MSQLKLSRPSKAPSETRLAARPSWPIPGKHFVAVRDIAFFQGPTLPTEDLYALRIRQMLSVLQAVSIPVVSAVNGTAHCGGSQLMMTQQRDEKMHIGKTDGENRCRSPNRILTCDSLWRYSTQLQEF